MFPSTDRGRTLSRPSMNTSPSHLLGEETLPRAVAPPKSIGNPGANLSAPADYAPPTVHFACAPTQNKLKRPARTTWVVQRGCSFPEGPTTAAPPHPEGVGCSREDWTTQQGR